MHSRATDRSLRSTTHAQDNKRPGRNDQAQTKVQTNGLERDRTHRHNACRRRNRRPAKTRLAPPSIAQVQRHPRIYLSRGKNSRQRGGAGSLGGGYTSCLFRSRTIDRGSGGSALAAGGLTCHPRRIRHEPCRPCRHHRARRGRAYRRDVCDCARRAHRRRRGEPCTPQSPEERRSPTFSTIHAPDTVECFSPQNPPRLPSASPPQNPPRLPSASPPQKPPGVPDGMALHRRGSRGVKLETSTGNDSCAMDSLELPLAIPR